MLTGTLGHLDDETRPYTTSLGSSKPGRGPGCTLLTDDAFETADWPSTAWNKARLKVPRLSSLVIQRFCWSNSFCTSHMVGVILYISLSIIFPSVWNNAFGVVCVQYHGDRNSWKLVLELISAPKTHIGLNNPAHWFFWCLLHHLCPSSFFLFFHIRIHVCLAVCSHPLVCPALRPPLRCAICCLGRFQLFPPAQTWVGRSDGAGRSWQPARVS